MEQCAALPPDILARIGTVLLPRTTKLKPENYGGNWIALYSSDKEALSGLGINLIGDGTVVYVRSLTNRVGDVTITAQGAGATNIPTIDNAHWTGTLTARVRISRENVLLVFNLAGADPILLPHVWMRSPDQMLFWGSGSTAVSLNFIEVEGLKATIVIGDDALISSGIVIRNFDMHSIVDLATGHRVNQPIDLTIERHVWLGQEVLLLGCNRIGYGSIVGARSFVKGVVPAKSIVAGSPAKVLASNRSWGRGMGRMSEVERTLIMEMDDLPS